MMERHMEAQTTSTTPKSATEAHEHVQQAALAAAQRTTELTALSVGEYVHQGDVYLVRVRDGVLPYRKQLAKGRQLAPGNNPGARHVIDPDAEVTIYTEGVSGAVDCAKHALLGPLVVAESAFTLMHPEHGHMKLPAGTYQTLFQVDAVTGRRVLD
jgi:hypothetical protein